MKHYDNFLEFPTTEQIEKKFFSRSRRLRHVLLLCGGFLSGISLFVPSLNADDRVPNAALKYWQAFETMPKMSEKLQDKLKAACSEEGFKTRVDRQLEKLIEQSEYSLRMFRRGAAIKNCDWGIDFRADGAETLLPHLAKARRLAWLALLRSRYHFERRENETAVSDVVSVMTIARHVSHDGTLIGSLLGYSIEINAVRVMAAYLPQIDGRSLMNTALRFDSLPKMVMLSTAVASEELFLDWAIEKVKLPGEGQLLDFCLTLTTSKQQAEDLLVAGGGRDEFIHHLADLRPCYAEMRKLISLPAGQFEEGNSELTRRLAANPLAKFLTPNLATLHKARAVYRCYQSLLDTAIDIQSNGQAALQSHPDPYGEGDFEYSVISTGKSANESVYRLRSRLQRQTGAFVQLTVGITER